MARRNRKTPTGRDDRNAARARGASQSVPRLGRRKALWRFVGAMALAPLTGAAFGQDMMMSPMGPGGGAPIYAPGAYPPVVGLSQAGYVGHDQGYVVPAGAAGPMGGPPPSMMPQGGPRIGIPTGSTFSPRLVTTGGYGDGLGWDDGYQSIGAWLPLGLNNDSMVMYLDARGFASFEENGGGNFTLGYRYYMPGFDRFFGVYGAYDIDAGNADGQTFNRFAVGGESVGRYLTYRVNGYIPVGDGSDVVSSGQVGNPFFEGNNILFLDRTLTRYQYGGVDGEMGGPLPLVGKYGLSGFLGGYYLTSDDDDTVGFKGRLEANINDDLQIGGKLTTDDVFDTNVWVTMSLRSPRGSWSNFFRKDWLRQPSVQTQMDRSPEREYRIATDVKTTESPTLAINPLDGQPYLVLHVDPTSGSGTGTFESPAGTIANNPNFDIIYVQPGVVATNGPIALFDNQRLLSTAVPHNFDSQRGTFALPGFTGGALPLLQNTAATPTSVVVLADNNEVSGFQIDGTGGINPFTSQQVFHAGINGDSITSFDINRNVFSNITSGVQILHVGEGTGLLTGNFVTGRGTGSSLGLSVAAVDGSNLALGVVGNTVSGFLGEDANSSASLDPGEDVNGNFALDSGIGINIVGTRTSTVGAVVANNIVTGNDTGLRIASLEDAVVNASVRGNNISNNLGAGASIAAQNGTQSASFAANTISNNGGTGINATAGDGADLTLDVSGSTVLSGNVIDANAGAGIALTVGTQSVARTTIVNNEITNTVDDGTALTRFAGEGINILAGADGQLVESTIDRNAITNSEGDGIRIQADDLATVRNILIGNTDGDNNNGNLITGNADGIHIIRRGNSRIDEIVIRDNEVFENVSGLVVDAAGGLLDVTDFVAAENTFSRNLLSGVRLDVAADGVISSTLQNNLITSNLLHGILTTQDRFTVDAAGITGEWTGNLISNNGGNGILSFAPTNDLVVGAADAPNIIFQNSLAGVLISGPGSAAYRSNLIAQNGQGLNSGDANDNSFGAGVDIRNNGFKFLTFTENVIIDNFGDGVEIASRDNGFFTFDINFVDNNVSRNLGRGYDILNTGDGELLMTIRGTAPGRSVIAQNGREGVYVVNTASNTQTQQGDTPLGGSPNTDPTHGMDATGAFDAQTFMTFTFTGNQVIANGNAQSGLPGKGLVMRVGTSGGGYGRFTTGGFASEGFAGVIATVDNNFFSGNAGSDFYVESFTSTVAPPATAGTWDEDEFTITNYEGDPLARLDLSFVGNTFDTIDVNNTGAFYNNAEGTFKSRTDGDDFTVDGPFETDTRRRNAQRLADRGGLPPFGTPNPPGSPAEFDYPGMGESTFRITQATLVEVGGIAATIPNNIFFPQPFLVDNLPYSGFFDARGVIYSDNVDFGELPFGWGVIQ